MLPRPDLAVLAASPRFEALYQDLCSNRLNPDGTTKLDLEAQRESEGLAEVCGSWALPLPAFGGVFADANRG